jgi:hypothetical protein
MNRALFMFALGVSLCACSPSDDEQAKAAAPMTRQERQIVERAFCAALNGDPNRDVMGIAPAVNDAVEQAGVDKVRTVFITAQWFSDLSDHKIPSACGKAIVGYEPAS